MKPAVRLKDKFFAPRQEQNLRSTIPSAIAKCDETGRLEAFKLNWTKESGKVCPHIYWDSDVAKVMEGMAYVSNIAPEIGEKLDELVDLVVSAQQPDGYLNTHFTVSDREMRWKNLFNCHELYCAGHLMEAAVAHYEATGKRKFLDAMVKYADYICSVFGKNGNQGYPGHEEIELALCKLYRATGNEKYLEQAKLFVDRRGTEPNYYLENEPEWAFPFNLANRQAHIPVRLQHEAVGHAVRAVYLYSGMADVAAATGDAELMASCERLFDNISQAKMFVTGGIGSSQQGESFSHDLDLPPDRCYAESCAAIGLVFFASRMLKYTGKRKYADVVEKALFNGAISGLALSGDKFFYGNLLECHNGSLDLGHVYHERQPWFTTSCCPTSYCRFLPQIGNFCFRADADMLAVDVPVASEIVTDTFAVEILSGYPYDGKITVKIVRGGEFELALRIPAWCKNFSMPAGGSVADGYWKLKKLWRDGEEISYTLDMPVEKVFSRAPNNFGKAAICRGPLVYCVEFPADSEYSPFRLRIPADAEFKVVAVDSLLPGACGIEFTAMSAGEQQCLYSSEMPEFSELKVVAIPYALWQNNGAAQMAVYLPFNV